MKVVCCAALAYYAYYAYYCYCCYYDYYSYYESGIKGTAIVGVGTKIGWTGTVILIGGITGAG